MFRRQPLDFLSAIFIVPKKYLIIKIQADKFPRSCLQSPNQISLINQKTISMKKNSLLNTV